MPYDYCGSIPDAIHRWSCPSRHQRESSCFIIISYHLNISLLQYMNAVLVYSRHWSTADTPIYHAVTDVQLIHNATYMRHYNEHDGVSNHQPHHCLLKHLFRCRSKKTSKLPVTGLCEGNPPVSGRFHPHKGPVTRKIFHLMTSSCWKDCLGAVSIRKTVLPGMAIPMLKIRRPNGRLIFNMEIAIRR